MTILAVAGLRKEWPDGGQGLSVDLLELAEGETVALTGDNGAGKTTLLRILAGLLPFDSGEVSWRGSRVGSLRAGRDAAYLHQQPYLLSRSARANVEYALRAAGRPAAESGGLLEWAGLAGRACADAGALSAGEGRRLALARIRATAAPLVLLDEPTANLDAAGVAAVGSMVRDMASDGRTVVAAFQDGGVPDGIGSRRSLRMEGGRIAGGGG